MRESHKRNRFEHRPKSVHVNESSKVVQIKDFKDNLRYKVILTSNSEENPYSYLDSYKVVVVAYLYGSTQGLQILEISEKDGRPCTDYKWIQRQFEKCVENYSSLVKAEIRDFQDISVYKDKIGYKKVQLKCCKTCKFCKEFNSKDDYIFGRSGVLECHCPKNEERYKFDIEFENPRHRKKTNGAWSRLPWQNHLPSEEDFYDEDHEVLNRIFPKVDEFGCCENYEEDRKHYQPVPGDSLGEMIDYQVDRKFKDLQETFSDSMDTVMSSYIEGVNSTVSSYIENSVSTIIIPEVGKAIENQLTNTIFDGGFMVEDYNGNNELDDDDYTIIGG